MPTLDGQVALVTGASRGIGAAVALRLARDGARVFVNYRADASGADSVVHAIRAGGGRADALQADVSRVPDVRTLVDRAADAGGRLDILVNNAAICLPGTVDSLTEADFDGHFAANVKSVLFASQAAVPHLALRGGAIVNVSSVNGRRPAAGASVYSASKAAVDAITVALAEELGPRRIRVNAVAPGATDTAMLRGANPADAVASIGLQTPLGRLGLPEDIARAVAFLASEEASWITGQVLAASGGL